MNYTLPLMQCLTNDLRSWNFELLTTKCLNTAVMLMYFLKNNRGLFHARYCSSTKLTERRNNNIDVVNSLTASILSNRIKYRKIYYILMNDASFPRSTGGGSGFFPGHVFLLEKIPKSGKKKHPTYNVYQSYINKYDLLGHYEKNSKSLEYSYEQTEELMENLKYILTVGVWDEKCVEAWQKFTYVDTSDLLGCITKDYLYICYSYDDITHCIDGVYSYIKDKLDKTPDNDEVYGNPNYYDNHEVKPLTNREMRIQLNEILNHILKK